MKDFENKESWWHKLFKSPVFIGVLLIVIPLAEWVIGEFIKNLPQYTVCCNPYFVWGIILFFMLLLAISIGCALNYFSLSTVTLFRFFSNEIGSRPLNLLFAFVFAMHLSWICDSGYDLIFKDEETYWIYWSRLILAVVGMICIFMVFPRYRKIVTKVSPKNRKLLVMGLSEIKLNKKFKNIETVIKPFGEYSNIRTVIILFSNRMNMERQNVQMKSPLENLNKSEKDTEVPNTGEKGQSSQIDLAILEKGSKLYEVYASYNQLIEKYKNKLVTEDNKEPLIQQLKQLFIANIEYYYPTIPEPDKINFIFSTPVDYDDFMACYKTVDKYLNVFENDTKDTVINISPGTSLVTGAMSIHAIKGQRQLVYTKQKDDELAICDPNVWTLGQLMQELTHELITDRIESD